MGGGLVKPGTVRQVGDLRPWEADMQIGGQPGLHRDPSQPGLKKNCHAEETRRREHCLY